MECLAGCWQHPLQSSVTADCAYSRHAILVAALAIAAVLHRAAKIETLLYNHHSIPATQQNGVIMQQL